MELSDVWSSWVNLKKMKKEYFNLWKKIHEEIKKDYMIYDQWCEIQEEMRNEDECWQCNYGDCDKKHQ